MKLSSPSAGPSGGTRSLGLALLLSTLAAPIIAQGVGQLGAVPGANDCRRTVGDPSIAISNQQIVHTVNSRIEIRNRSSLIVSASDFLDENPITPGVTTFFGGQAGLGATRIVQTKVLFDQRNDRFYVVGLQRDTTVPGLPGIYIARSTNGNPTLATWTKWRMPLPTGTGFTPILGSTSLGLDDSRLIITAIIFEDVSGVLTARGHLYRTIDLSVLGSSIGVLPFSDITVPLVGRQPFELAQPAHSFDPGSTAYLAGATNLGNAVRLSAIQPGATVPDEILVAVPQHILPGFGTPGAADGAPQPNSLMRLDPSDGRMGNAVLRDGSLWTCHTNSTGFGGKNVIRYYEFDLQGWPTSGNLPTLIDSDVFDPGNSPGGNPLHAFQPSIMPDDVGNALMAHHQSATDISPRLCVAGHAANTVAPNGTLAAFQILNGGVGGGPVTLPGPNGLAAFGNGTDMASDPMFARRIVATGVNPKVSGFPGHCFPVTTTLWSSAIGRVFMTAGPGSVAAFGGAGVAGPAGTIPVHAQLAPGTGAPIGSVVQLTITNDTTIGAGAPALWILGDNGNAAGVPLFNGLLFVDPAGAQSLGITFAGAGPETLNLPVPLNPALINATFFSQCIEFDVNFTTAFSNALQIQIGFL